LYLFPTGTADAPLTRPGGEDLTRNGHSVLTLVTCILASSLAFIDGSVVNVGLPAIGRSLSGDAPELQWLIGGYLLPLSALLLLGGSLGDKFGRRRMLVLGVLLFGVASAACGVAPSLPMLITTRFLQGIGAALLMPNSLAILGSTFAGKARGRAIGIWAAAGAATGAAGPVLGGWLIDAISWRMIFFINLPLVAGSIILALRYVHKDPEGDRPPLDLIGAILATVSLGALTWGLIIGTGRQGWTAPAVAGLGAGLALLAAFVAWEGGKGRDAMMPLSLFGSRSFAGLTLLTLLLYGALGGLLVLLPYVLIETGGYSSTMAGVALLPLPLIIAATSPMLGGVAGRFGARPLLVAGPLIVTAGLLLLVRVNADMAYWATVFPGLLVISAGMACAVAPLTTAVLASVDPVHTGSASGFNSAIARTGGLVATALLGSALASRGGALVENFHAALIVAALACVAAAASAALTDRT
jgi:EmrB/QacA subfamily drug resistance transporter